MKYEDFEKFVREKCMYETIYDDSNGRQVLVIQMLDAYGMVNKAPREWVGLTDEEIEGITARVLTTLTQDVWPIALSRAIEAKLKEKNSG